MRRADSDLKDEKNFFLFFWDFSYNFLALVPIEYVGTAKMTIVTVILSLLQLKSLGFSWTLVSPNSDPVNFHLHELLFLLWADGDWAWGGDRIPFKS